MADGTFNAADNATDAGVADQAEGSLEPFADAGGEGGAPAADAWTPPSREEWEAAQKDREESKGLSREIAEISSGKAALEK